MMPVGFVDPNTGTQTIYNTDTSGNITSYKEVEKDGTTTDYTVNGIPYDKSDPNTKIVTDGQGNQVVQTTNSDGSYKETEADGTETTYTKWGGALQDGDKIVYDSAGNQMIHHDNGNGTYTEIESDGTTTTYKNDGSIVGQGKTTSGGGGTGGGTGGGAGAGGKPQTPQQQKTNAQKALDTATKASQLAQGTKNPTVITAAQKQLAAAQQQAAAAGIPTGSTSSTPSWAIPVAIVGGLFMAAVIVALSIKSKK